MGQMKFDLDGNITEEHDGCEGCVNMDKTEKEHPCVDCKGTHSEGGFPDLWTDKVQDDVNHPSHYVQEDSIECIDEMIAVFGKTAVQHFCLLNVWKYRKRAIFKNGAEDLKKSDWYMKKYLELGGKVVKL